MPKRQVFRSLTRGDVKTALSMLRQNRGRSLVTIFGIVIAVVSVIVIIGIGEGVKQQVRAQTNRLGRNLILIRPASTQQGSGGVLGSLAAAGPTDGLDDRDYQAVQSVQGVSFAVPLSTIDGIVRGGDDNAVYNGPVIATSPAFVRVLHQQVQYGSFLGDGDQTGARAVIGANVAETLFGQQVPLGHTFNFRGQQFIVGGVLDRFETNPLLGDANFNNAIFIKYSEAQELSQNHVKIYEILAEVNDSDRANTVAGQLRQKLRGVHGGANGVSVLQQGDSVAATDTILQLLTRFTIGAAAIALLLGGIGVMNIMLVAVTERTHEIGIRKAVGATNRQILAQFLLESVVLSALGGIIGYALGGFAIALLRWFSDFQPAMPWLSGGIIVAIAIAVGALFGTFPASKAARKDPIEALRNE